MKNESAKTAERNRKFGNLKKEGRNPEDGVIQGKEEEVEDIYHDTMEEAEREASRDKEEEEVEDIYHDTMEGRESKKEKKRRTRRQCGRKERRR